MSERHKPINSPISESFEVVKNGMKPKCPSIWEWINKIWHSCARIILYSTENKLTKFTQHLSSIFGWKKAAIKFAQSLSHVQLSSTPWTNPPDSSIHGILQARILEWVAIPFLRGYSRPRDQTQVLSTDLTWVVCCVITSSGLKEKTVLHD